MSTTCYLYNNIFYLIFVHLLLLYNYLMVTKQRSFSKGSLDSGDETTSMFLYISFTVPFLIVLGYA
jgi:hypothetical protein